MNPNKKSKEELQDFMHFRRRGFVVPSKRGKRPYTRKTKHKGLNKED